jgi:hypothetical protein
MGSTLQVIGSFQKSEIYLIVGGVLEFRVKKVGCLEGLTPLLHGRGMLKELNTKYDCFTICETSKGCSIKYAQNNNVKTGLNESHKLSNNAGDFLYWYVFLQYSWLSGHV